VRVGTMYLPNLVAKLSVSRLLFGRYLVWIPAGSANVLSEGCSFFNPPRTCWSSTQFKSPPVNEGSVPSWGTGFPWIWELHPARGWANTRYRGWLRHCVQGGRSRVRFPMLSLEFSPVAYSGCNRNEYQEYFLRAGMQGWQLYHLHVPIVLKSGSLKLLEPSGPVQACTGTA
jgi:hypothetical protein